jgi:formylglycine-generating enzyme required for sulfatase activity
MAPEMWKMKVSLQSDQYSLAATYVRARLGRHLFTTNILVDLANFHINETPNLDPLPQAEQKVLLKAMAKDPDNRYRNCAEFAKALRAAAMPVPEPPKPQPQKEGNSGALWRTLLIVLACALVVGGVNWFTRKTDEPKDPNAGKNDKDDKDKPPEKKYAVIPDNWTPDPKAGEQLLVDKYYHKKLTRKIGDREIAAYLIYSNSAIRPEPFYMLEHKVTNKVFSEVWSRLASDMRVQNLLADPSWRPDAWQKDDKGKPLDINGDDGNLPALGVTVPQAIVVAEWLGGSLPTFRQWQKATGVLEDSDDPGPAGSVLQKPPPPLDQNPIDLTKEQREELAKWKRDQFAARNLALGIPKALKVESEEAKGDLSRWKIRQLVTNGQEWLGQAHDNNFQRIALSPRPDRQVLALYVGYFPHEAKIDSVEDLRNYRARAEDWLTTEGQFAGFRVVLMNRDD